MSTITLDKKEVDALLQVLNAQLPTLAVEIHHTDSREFKQGLQAREATLSGLRSRLLDLQRGGVSSPGAFSPPDRH